MGNKRKGKASHGPPARKATAQRNASAYARSGGDIIQRVAGRVRNEDAVRRGGVVASEACRDRALQERDNSRAQVAAMRN